MVYNKFKQGFLSNIWTYSVTLVFFAMAVFVLVTDPNIIESIIGIASCIFIMVWLIYDQFFSEVFVFYSDSFCTNKFPFDYAKKYMPPLFRKVKIQFDDIEKIEKRVWSRRQFSLIITVKDDEPIKYVFSRAATRDFIYEKLLEYQLS